MTASRQVTTSGSANTYTMSYGYNLAGEMTKQVYPSGKEYRTSFDDAGRLSEVSRYNSSVFDKTYASAFTYSAHGAVSAMTLGNGKWEHTLFNGRIQPTEIGLGASSAASDLLKLEYTYNTTEQANNNGNVLTQKITAPKTAGGNLVLTQNYSYDALNRLSVAEELISTASQWKQTYDIDRWGNRAVRSNSYILPQNVNLTPQSASSTDFSALNQNTNRIALGGFGYDTAGNVTADPTTGANAIVYDAENRQTSYTKAGATTSYSYDGDGHRVKRTDPDNTTTIFVYNAGGQLIAEYTSGTPSGGGTSYLTSDHLGSTRVVTSAADGSGNVTVKARYDYLPFGEEIGSDHGNRSSVTGYGSSDKTRQKFTQKERDSESGLDYFLARYYSSAQGRFTSADQPFVGQHLSDPQSWNLFVYGRNNPLLYVDPTGEDYNIFDKDGNLIGQAKDQKDLEGYVLVSSENEGNLLKFKGGYRAEYFEGDPGKAVQAKDDSGMTPIARGVLTELDRSASGSLQLIGGFAVGTAVIGATGGAAAYFAPGVIPFIAPAVQKVSVTGPTVAVTLLAKAQDPKLRNIINDLYRVTAKIGSGSSADAFRAEGSHGEKLVGYTRGLEKLLRKPGLSASDRSIAKQLINDMKNALSGK